MLVGETSQELTTEDCPPHPLHPGARSPATLGSYWDSWGAGPSPSRGVLGVSLQPQVWAKKGAAFAGRLQGRGSCGRALPRLLAIVVR